MSNDADAPFIYLFAYFHTENNLSVLVRVSFVLLIGFFIAFVKSSELGTDKLHVSNMQCFKMLKTPETT